VLGLEELTTAGGLTPPEARAIEAAILDRTNKHGEWR
jgi:hypothetical protein